ncbi:MAG: EscU/YscU/HrcU family type III secretion system export apparatus switch protein [Verrucomicrobiota bacterium]
MSEEKELPATAKRRMKLRQQGQVPKSQDISNTVMIAAALFGLLVMGGYWGNGMANIMAACFREIEKAQTLNNPATIISILLNPGLMLSLGIFFGVVMLCALLSQMFQVGILFTMQPLQINFGRLNPVGGLKKLFSLPKLVQTLISFIKLLVILFFMYSGVKVLLADPVFIRMVNVQEIGNYMVRVAWEIGWRVLLTLIGISLVDYLYQKWQYERNNRMSKVEYKEEHKQTEGSPVAKKRLRSKRREITLRRMMENMADATVVITNPTHYAVALRYVRDETETPMIVAKGMRLIALKIRKRAEELGVPQMENRELAQGLHKYGVVGQPIPVLFYHAVAIILAELYRRGFRQSSAS